MRFCLWNYCSCFYYFSTILAVGISGITFCSTGCFPGIFHFCFACMVILIQFSIGFVTNRTFCLVLTGCCSSCMSGCFHAYICLHRFLTLRTFGMSNSGLCTSRCLVSITGIDNVTFHMLCFICRDICYILCICVSLTLFRILFLSICVCCCISSCSLILTCCFCLNFACYSCLI